MKNIVYFLTLLCLLAVSLHAQKPERLTLDQSVWKESIKDVSYDPIKEKKAITKPRESKTSTNWNPSGLQPFLFVIIIIVIIVVLILILRKAKQPANIKAVRVEANTLAEAEENLPDVKLNKIYQEALDKGEYKAALRIKFLMILQNMIDSGMIAWKKRKTNEQYLRELSQNDLKLSFQDIVKLYDSVWYGSMVLTADQYQLIIQRINSLNQQLHGQE